MTYSIINKSQLEGTSRLDAEYYQPEYLDIASKIKRLSHRRLGDLCSKITDGSHQTPQYQEAGIPFLMVKDVLEQQINFGDGLSYISKDFDKSLANCKPEAGDILLTKVGSVGISAVVPEKAPNFNIFVSLAILKNCKNIDKFFLSTFLNSKYGKSQAIRSAKGISQPDLHLEDIREFLIPLPPKSEQNVISKVARRARNLLDQSKILYSQAEELFLKELGLDDFQSQEKISSTVNLTDLKSTDRMDAEYFQSKYENLISKINLKNPKALENFIMNYSTGYPFKSVNYQEKGIPLIRINNIKKGILDLSDTAFLTEKDFSLSPKDTAKSGDVVLSMSGTIGLSTLIPEDIPKCAVNQRILKFTPQNIDEDYLVLLLNSIIGSYQLRRIGTGGVQTNISYKDIKNILIPILPKSTQQKIADLVRKSHKARTQAKLLLQTAKKKVGDLIEGKK